jgi:Raf kinase inhibitor-like YbhB/YbcL family protein
MNGTCFAARIKTIYMFTLISVVMNAILAVSSPAFGPNTMIPTKYTCQGASISPALHIGEFPAGTKSLAIILHDPDAGRPGGFTHWVVFNIDPTADIPEGYKGGVQALNGAAKAGYVGPCPPTGVHHYHFMVYALDTRLELSAKSGKAELEKAMEGHILAQGDLVGLYSKTK